MAPRNMQQDRGQSTRERLLWAEKSAGAGSYCRVGGGVSDRRKPGFIAFFCMARRLLRNMRTNCRPLSRVALLEFCHVLCSGRCVIGHRCPQGADIVEII